MQQGETPTLIKISRRATLQALGASALAMPYVIRPRPSWAQCKVVNVTTYDKFVPQAFIDKFQARHRHRGAASASPTTRASSTTCSRPRAPTPTTDIVTVVSHRMPQFVDSNLLAPLDTGRLKNWKTLNSAYQERPWLEIDGKRYGVPILAGFEGMARNTDHVEDTDSWGIMFDPQVQGTDLLHRQRLPLGGDALPRRRRRLRDLHGQARGGAEGDQRGARLPDQEQEAWCASYYDGAAGSAADVHQRGHLPGADLVRPGGEADHGRAPDRARRCRRRAPTASSTPSTS